jgi:hypothetical protein
MFVIISFAQEDTDYEGEYIDVDDYLEPQYDPTGVFVSLDFDMEVPILLSRQNNARINWGGHMQLLYQFIRSSPIFMGFSISFGQYDHESIEYYDFTEFEENLFKETFACSFLHLDVKSRYFPGWSFSVFEPFVDLTLGARNAYSYTTITNMDYGETVNSYSNESDWGFQYGIGLGTLIRINALNSPNVFLHYSMNYTGGENSFVYLIKDDLSGNEEPVDRFDRKSIPYQFLKMNLGLIFHF